MKYNHKKLKKNYKTFRPNKERLGLNSETQSHNNNNNKILIFSSYLVI